MHDEVAEFARQRGMGVVIENHADNASRAELPGGMHRRSENAALRLLLVLRPTRPSTNSRDRHL